MIYSTLNAYQIHGPVSHIIPWYMEYYVYKNIKMWPTKYYSMFSNNDRCMETNLLKENSDDNFLP